MHSRAQKKYTVVIAFGNLGIGGVQTKIRDVSTYLTKIPGNNIEIHILLRDVPKFNLEAATRGDRIIIHHRPTLQSWHLHVPFSIYFFIKTLIIQPDVILTFYDTLSALSICTSMMMFRNRPRVILNEDTFPSLHVPNPFKRLLIRLMYPYAHTVIVPTRAAKNDLVSHFHIPDKKIAVIPNWTLQVKKVPPHKRGAHL